MSHNFAYAFMNKERLQFNILLQMYMDYYIESQRRGRVRIYISWVGRGAGCVFIWGYGGVGFTVHILLFSLYINNCIDTFVSDLNHNIKINMHSVQ